MSNLSDSFASNDFNREIKKEINANLSVGFMLYAEQLKRLNELTFLPKSSGIYFQDNCLIVGDKSISTDYLPEGSIDGALDFNSMSYACPKLKSGEFLSLLDLEDSSMPVLWWEDWKDEINFDEINNRIKEDELCRQKYREESKRKAALAEEIRQKEAEEFYQRVLVFLKWNANYPRHKAHCPKLVNKLNVIPSEKHPETIRWGKYPNHVDCTKRDITYAKQFGANFAFVKPLKPVIKTRN